jgi:hypothetical protein
MIDRMTRASQLNVDLYEEVEHNPGLDGEARTVVILVSALAALGVLVTYLFRGNIGAGIGGAIGTAILGVIQWYLWSFITLLIGTRMFGGTADFGQVSRAIAYASTPNALRVLMFIPILGGLLALIAAIWSAVCGVVAVRQAMDFDSGKAIATVVIAWAIALIPNLILVAILT